MIIRHKPPSSDTTLRQIIVDVNKGLGPYLALLLKGDKVIEEFS